MRIGEGYIALLVLALVLILVVGCASPEARYLTLEEDQAVREICEPAGCVTVPAPMMERILRMLPRQMDA